MTNAFFIRNFMFSIRNLSRWSPLYAASNDSFLRLFLPFIFIFFLGFIVKVDSVNAMKRSELSSSLWSVSILPHPLIWSLRAYISKKTARGSLDNGRYTRAACRSNFDNTWWHLRVVEWNQLREFLVWLWSRYIYGLWIRFMGAPARHSEMDVVALT